MEIEHNVVFIHINLSITITIVGSVRNLFIDFLKFIIESNLITLLSCFTFIPKTGIGLFKRVIIFYCVEENHNLQCACLAEFSATLLVTD